ncbi:hypothetical protein QBC47DRAFT_360888 [Echria macrotheca]|uniref:Uncharacterized protein n=1 Tax=Echria macrotheca TaxID=438768 RepID=A0AAJ0F8Z0_9PEZI|nr:hypothetical protein QBC47DRAFT_360888 [Echria macrotheca]
MTANNQPAEQNQAAGQQDGPWVLLQNPGDRPPQYNSDNESQPQLAGSSNGEDDEAFVLLDGNMVVGYISAVGSDNAESQATSMMSEVTGATTTAVNATGLTPVTPSFALTKTALAMNERESRYGSTGSVPTWLTGVSFVGERTGQFDVESTQADSMYYRTGRSGQSSLASSVHVDDIDSTPLERSLTLLEVGAWCKRFGR